MSPPLGNRAGYAERMTGSRLSRLLPSLFFFAAFTAALSQQRTETAFTIKPAVVEVGSPELITASARGATSMEGEWLGHKLQFFHHDGKWIALAGVDVETTPQTSTLHITAQTSTGPRDFSRTIEIHPAHYRTGKLTVAPKFVEPGPEEQKEIAAASEIKAKIFATSAPEPLWHGDFRAPVKAPPTDSFGTRRMFNGKVASIHKGMDFRAHTGSVVRASNSGIVVLARPLYFEGNCVIIDHGLGLYTLSMHFSRIDVHEGQHVETGDKLGLSGATGRVTGPHLHWAVRWENAYLDPAKLLHLNLNAVH
jgi:murein DD-endopeptidase MepM/ murein hydrolase activator NlpD